MSGVRLIDRRLLTCLAADAAASPRRRKNLNFHAADDCPAHRLLNAVEPDSYVMPHRHLDPRKDETIIVLQGRLGVLVFDDDGAVAHALVLAPGGETCGVDIPHGVYHSVLACAPATVMFESKSGPFLPLAQAEKAPWAPTEGSPEAAPYLARLRVLLPG